ncbi:putative RNA-binding protein 15B [Trichoplax sp. H2]|nr:putative RNA-binding protein 15B [Trichoplax sp. H2]|eukprot:RDD39276.1 putative RNA-binding protein 15B [Trichoplax sp. H2]
MKRKVGRDFSGDLRHDLRHDRQSAMYGKRERMASPGRPSQPQSSRSPNYHHSQHSSGYHNMDDRIKRKVVEVPSHRSYPDRHRRDTDTSGRLKLKITNLPRDRSDEDIENKLYYQFKKFGQPSIHVQGFGKSRYGVINFKHNTQCREAKSFCEQNSIYVFDRPVNVEYYQGNPQDDMDDIRSDDSSEFYSNRGRDNRRQYPSRIDVEDDYSQSSNTHRRQDWKQGGRRNTPITSNRSGSGYYNNQQQQMEFLEDIPNRTLFIGNLDTSISNYELRRIFGRYTIIDMDVKRHRGQFVGYAFIKLATIREADKAKSEMDGNVLGRNRIKIGYGKVYPSKRLWLGGLGTWINRNIIEQECDRFGALREVDYDYKNNKYAEVEFATVDASKAAFEELTHNTFGRTGRHVEVEYVDTQHQYFTATSFRDRQQRHDDDDGNDSHHDIVESRSSRREEGDYYNQRSYTDRSSSSHRDDYYQRDNPPVPRRRSEERRQDYAGRRSNRKPYSPHSGHDRRPGSAGGKSTEWVSSPRPSSSSYSNYDEPHRHRERREYTPEGSIHADDETRDNREERDWIHEPRSPSNDKNNALMRASSADKESPIEYEGHTAPDGLTSFIIQEKFKHWDTSFLLKSSKFMTRLFFVSGSMDFADSIMDNIDWSSPQSPFRITQRLRLDNEKLGEVNKRIENAGPSNFCYVLAMDRNEFTKDEISPEDDANLTGREFRNLVMYLRQKDAAGVVMLEMADNVECIVHVFPPCQFSNNHLMEAYPRINQGYLSQDHLLLIMVKVLIA